MNRIEVNCATGEQTVVTLTDAEIAAATAATAESNSVANTAARIQRQRAAAYPPATDYLDAWVKGDAVALEAYRAACMAVKVKYPKP
jgi:hypothetical protein